MTSTFIIPAPAGELRPTASAFDVIIIGGSFAGLSAALALGRATRSVLVIDAGHPCNHMVEAAHNFLTHDGDDPNQLRARARDELMRYGTVRLIAGRVTGISGSEGSFEVSTVDRTWMGGKILLATGVKDVPPAVPGLAECWGRSVLHCPFCHGHEVRDKALGVLGSGTSGHEFVRLIRNWSAQLTLFTNGPAALMPEQREELTAHGVLMNEVPIDRLVHDEGLLSHVLFEDGSQVELRALFVRMPFRIPEELVLPLGCKLVGTGHVEVDDLKRTSVPGIYAAGDLTLPMRSLAAAIASGNVAGAAITHAFVSLWR
ncbi:MAG: NAD(P)/FAD-dependent oxidoreductase [Flavobacteriales bacterium]|nr:NAD(P)/FAD-dependent oxidoreductase [Flavobacteriales bacterium]